MTVNPSAVKHIAPLILLLAHVLNPAPTALQAQSDSTNQCIMVSTGLNYNSYHSVGARLFFDYSKEFAHKWYWAVSFEHTRHFIDGWAAPEDALSLNVSHNILSSNIYRHLSWYGDKLFLRAGVGAGIAHAFWNDRDRIAPAFNASLGMHIKIKDGWWITTSAIPFLVPTNRITYAPLRMEGYKAFRAGSVFNIGFQRRL